MKSFQEIQLAPSIGRALCEIGYEVPTPIQAKAIPVILLKRDLIGCAQTGTGKTAAFCIPILARLLRTPEKTGLILAPTRELAQQIEAVWKSLSKFSPEVKCSLLIGGASMQPQIHSLRGKPRLVVATPGRLLDHLNRGTVSLSRAEIMVLDEADRMLDMGFAPQLRQILRFLPKTRQTLLFSATWSREMDQLSTQYLNRDAVRITVGTTSQAASKVEQSSVETTVQKKNETLLDEINQVKGPTLVFARTQVRTDRVARYLSSYGLEVNRIHGGRSQGQRNLALQNFKSGKTRILVATDIAARGIDVPDIAQVINYDLPQLPEDYIHRIGRTARAGASGLAISLLTPEDREKWRQILKLLKNTGSGLPDSKSASLRKA